MISAIIPCKDERPEVLAATVESALAVCDEVVICDDGSADPVRFEHEAVRIVRHAKARGPAAAANAAAKAASGLFVARLDCGDRFYMSKREQLAVHIHENVQASFSLAVNERNGKPWPVPATWRTQLFNDAVFPVSSTVVSKALFAMVGGYDESLRYCDDWDFCVRVQAAHGWTPVLIITGTATCWDGGHTDLWNDETKKQRWSLDHAKVATLARSLAR